MVPKFEDFFFPCLQCLSDEKIHTQEDLRRYTIDYFRLSEEDVNLLIKSEKRTQVADRVAWTVTYLSQAKLIEAPKRGNYIITKSGKDFLIEHKKGFNRSDLLRIPSFSDFITRKRENNDAPLRPNTSSFQQGETPTDLIADAYNQINSSLAQDLLFKVLEMSPAFFERLVVELLVKMGYGGSVSDAANVTQYSKDDGVDGVIKEDKLGFDTIYVQAKRFNKGVTVGSQNIRDFIGALNIKHASKGVFITTSTFTENAKNSVKGIEAKVVLIDGEQLCKYLIEYNLGVSVRRTYEIKQIDNDYFIEE